ncbi:ABC transporter permease [Comamonas odontotermitis]|uniref:ABC transporter permease n=1 Tax=Comamonas odontotermitis TaxID=379895 RepID=UPI001CC77D4F|nr:ABC transporter permease [Comamonas odontotermitis]UBB19069.1 ABC transporter permease [Comamonas odontotermitis]
MTERVSTAAPGRSPAARAWRRFKSNKLGFYSLVVFVVLVVVSLFAEVISNDKPLVVRYEGHTYFPLAKDYPETTFGGDFHTTTDFLDPFIQQQLTKDGNWAIFPINRYGKSTINYFAKAPNPSPPSRDNWLGTDDRGRDLLAQLLYGFRVSVLFGLALMAIGVLLGVVAGAIQGFFGGKTDLLLQRLSEIWGSMPELYLLIIFSAVFAPSVALLLILLSLFGWLGLADYVRAEFLRNRQLDYVKSARALGVPNWQIMWRHILPNSLTPVVTFLPFRMSAAILTLTSLDFLGLGVPPGTPSLGELLSQGKNNIDAWWISLATFGVLVITLLLLTFMGDALRDALDPRKQLNTPAAPSNKAQTATQTVATSLPAQPGHAEVRHG